MIRLVIAALAVAIFGTTLHAGGHAVYRQHAVYQAVYPQVNYFVGAPVRVEALVAKALKDDPEYAELQKFKQWKALQQAAEKPADPAAVAQPAATILAAKCATCHGGATPKAGLLLDGTAPLTAEQALKAMRAVQSGEMPPKNKLTPEDAGEVFQDLLDLSKPEAPAEPKENP